MNRLIIDAKTENLDQVLGYVNEKLEEMDCPVKVQMQINVAVEEIFVNVAQYAYENLPERDRPGKVAIYVEESAQPRGVTITVRDRGIPFDPLSHEDPDITLSAQERGIGGLGIFMVKKSMDEVRYEYADGQNILTVFKKI